MKGEFFSRTHANLHEFEKDWQTLSRSYVSSESRKTVAKKWTVFLEINNIPINSFFLLCYSQQTAVFPVSQNEIIREQGQSRDHVTCGVCRY
jgi:hypothetical protein